MSFSVTDTTGQLAISKTRFTFKLFSKLKSEFSKRDLIVNAHKRVALKLKS